jgi:hypothetical protein
MEVDSKFPEESGAKPPPVVKPLKEYTVVKTGFQQKIKNKEFATKLDQYVRSLSPVAHLGALVFNRFLSKFFQETVPPGAFPNLFSANESETFLKKCFTLFTINSRPGIVATHPCLLAVRKEFENAGVIKYKRNKGDDRIIQYLARRYFTNFQNYLVFSFEGKQKRYITAFLKKHGFNPKQWQKYIQCKINNWTIRKEMDDAGSVTTDASSTETTATDTSKNVQPKKQPKKRKNTKKHKTEANTGVANTTIKETEEMDERSPVDDTDTDEIPAEILNFITQNQQWLVLTDGDKVDKVGELWIKKHPYAVLYYWYQMLKDIELNYPDDAQVSCRKFTLAPLNKLGRVFIDIDTEVTLPCLLNQLKLPFDATNPEHGWSQVVDMKSLITAPQREKGFRFNNHILTDGCSSICFQILKPTRPNDAPITGQKRKKPAVKTETVDELAKIEIQKHYSPKQRVIAFDPGRVTLLYGVESIQLDDNTLETKDTPIKLTRHDYHKYTGRFKQPHVTEKWKQDSGLQPIYTALSDCSLKTTQSEPWRKYLEIYVQHRDRLWEAALQKKHSKWKFRTFLLKRQYLDRFFVKLGKDKQGKKSAIPPIIAYGDGDFKCTGKGEQSVPNKEVYRTCKRYYKTILINEFRTTALCNCCHKPLCNVKTDKATHLEIANRAKKKEKKPPDKFWASALQTKPNNGKHNNSSEEEEDHDIRGLKWCQSTNCFKFINRDLNAANNIRDKFHWFANNEEIPPIFTRVGARSMPLPKGKEATKYIDADYHKRYHSENAIVNLVKAYATVSPAKQTKSLGSIYGVVILARQNVMMHKRCDDESSSQRGL